MKTNDRFQQRLCPPIFQTAVFTAAVALQGWLSITAPAVAGAPWWKQTIDKYEAGAINPSMAGPAITNLEKMLVEARRDNDVEGQLAIQTKLAQIYDLLGDNNKVIYYGQGATIVVQSKQQFANDLYYGQVLSVLGHAYLKASRYPEARNTYLQYYNYLNNNHGEINKILSCSIKLGHAYTQCGEFNKSIPLLSQVVAHESKDPSNGHFLMRAKLELAKAYWAQGHNDNGFMSTPNGQQMVRLLKEVSAYNGRYDTDAEGARREANGYISQLGIK